MAIRHSSAASNSCNSYEFNVLRRLQQLTGGLKVWTLPAFSDCFQRKDRTFPWNTTVRTSCAARQVLTAQVLAAHCSPSGSLHRSQNLRRSFAVPPIKHINTLEARKPAIASPKLTSTSPEECACMLISAHDHLTRIPPQERVQRAKSESAARDQWHQQRRLQQELQQMQQAASDGHSGTRQKLRRGSQEYPSSLSLLGKANSRQTSMELQRQSGTDAGGSTQDQQRGHVAAAGGSRRNSLEQRKGAAAAAARRSSLEQREGAAASGARRNSSMESSGGFRKSCSLARFEASHAQPPDNPPLAPSGAQNTTHPTTKGRGRGGALAHQHHEPPPPFAQPGRLRGSVPEFLLHGASPADEGQQPLMLPPDPSVGAHVDGMPQESRSGPLALYRGNGQPLPRRYVGGGGMRAVIGLPVAQNSC
eukprot:1141552-Pelagomonas_calceolata.AAC.2